MSIDKESDGLPGINVHKRTTKVNLSMIIAIVVFVAAMGAACYWISRG